MGIADALRFRDTVFIKETSDLQAKYDALKKLNEEYPGNEDLMTELFIVKKGLDGENEIAYQLKKAHIGMYVLRDVKVRFEDMTAQIDYVVITPAFTYYIECKNLVGNITVNEKGDFIREFTVNGKKIRKGMYSPLRQVEAQREVIRKIWENSVSSIGKVFASKNFDYYRRVLVVAANQETVLNTAKAPKEIKYKVLRADALVRQIEYEINHRESDYLESRKEMEKTAQSYLTLCIKDETDYYEFYKGKYADKVKEQAGDNLRERLIEFRKVRSGEMKIPAYYVFTNDELEKILEIRPGSVEELRQSGILPQVKVNTHGQGIIDLING